MNGQQSEILNIIEKAYGPTPDSVGTMIGIPITKNLSKDELFGIIWYMQKDFEEKEEMLKRSNDFYYQIAKSK